MVNHYTGSTALCQGDKSPATRWLLVLEPYKLGFLLVASFLSPHLVHFLACPIDCPYFRFRGSVNWAIGLAIGDALSIGGNVAIGLSGFLWWNLLSSFRRCMTAEEDFQVFSFLGTLSIQPNGITLVDISLVPWHRLHYLE